MRQSTVQSMFVKGTGDRTTDDCTTSYFQSIDQGCSDPKGKE